MKIIVFCLLLISSLFSNCPDSLTADVAEMAIKNSFSSQDEQLGRELTSIISHLKNNQKIEEDNNIISDDINKLHADTILELIEIDFLIKQSNNLIYLQR